MDKVHGISFARYAIKVLLIAFLAGALVLAIKAYIGETDTVGKILLVCSPVLAEMVLLIGFDNE